MNQLTLNLPVFSYHDLFRPEKLAQLSEIFYAEVKQKAPDVFEAFSHYQNTKGVGMTDVEISTVLVAMAPYLSAFLENMFGVENECKKFRIEAEKEHLIFAFKKDFFTRRALKKIAVEEAVKTDLHLLDKVVEALKMGFAGIPSGDPELEVSAMALELVAQEKKAKEQPLPEDCREYLQAFLGRVKGQGALKGLLPADASDPSLTRFLTEAIAVWEKWVVAHYHQKTIQTREWISFKLPNKIDFDHLVEFESFETPVPNYKVGHEAHYRRRDGFALTDERYPRREVSGEVDYCVICHERDKDSCSKGFTDPGGYKKNPLGYPLKGCPLDQKISESHVLQSRGDTIGALAIITIDNPLCPGTGHRICNDCMKACIYQKQEPVNIPQVETRILTDVLNLPWGFEIYSLLTRWNPLNIHRPHALPYNGKKILVVGMGPAGYSLAHYFLNEGFGVVGIDGLKIEPLSKEWIGDEETPFQPVRDFAAMQQRLDERVLMGFGGVSEYGITVRWDKNFLTVIYLNLLRRNQFRLYDGIRFGGTLTVEDAWDLGFDHLCLAAGAGKPTFVSMKNNLIRGVRKASDFLMALQLTGAGKKDSMANLQVQLPAIVIGGGLTAIDTATELLAYYPVQVSKTKQRYDRLVAKFGREAVDNMFDPEELGILHTFLQHGEEIERERERAKSAGEKPNFIPLIRSWGGVQIYYRKSINDAPAYRLNHEEIIKAFEEGMVFVEKMSPLEAVPDESGALKEMVFERLEPIEGKWKPIGEPVRVPAKTLIVAAGTVPNVMYERETPNTFKLDEWDQFFKSYTVDPANGGSLVEAQKGETGFFTSYEKDGKFVSYYGDNHPVFEGNVVKAMASAKNGYKKVAELFKDHIGTAHNPDELHAFFGKLSADWKASVVRIERLTPTIVELVVEAPMAARKFAPGQFYRLQNYEVDSPKVDHTLLMIEGLALTGAWVDKEKGQIGLIALEVGASSRMISLLKPGQRVVVMGPTGTPTEIDENSTALLLGGGLGNAVLFSIAKAFKEQGSKVVYFAGYKKKGDFYKREEIEAATDIVVYSVDAGEPIEAIRPQDKSFVGNIIQAMIAYADGKLGEIPIPLRDASRIIAIGSDRMMNAVTQARHGVLKPYLNENHTGVASINSPMQCMMKAVCAQCLQRHVNKDTGKEEFVFSCVNQDQLMDEVDFSNLNSRLKQNSVLEKITNSWLSFLIEEHQLEKA
ncbi:MAG: FAD-dependent oxidoreductase [Saprospirales bacterium]|nr:FAD-dependent oxidoreductase [Saprospirales bacterium]